MRAFTRTDCILLGGGIYVAAACLFAVGPALVLFQRGDTARLNQLLFTTYLLLAVLAPFGGLAGLVRFQIKRGTTDEQAGGGGCAQVLFVLPIIFFYLALVLMPGLFLIAAGKLLKLDLWPEGKGKCPPLISVVIATLCWYAINFAIALDNGTVVLGSVISADLFTTWLIFRLADGNRLANPGAPQIPKTFSLLSMMIAVLALGAYLTVLFGFFRDRLPFQ